MNRTLLALLLIIFALAGADAQTQAGLAGGRGVAQDGVAHAVLEPTEPHVGLGRQIAGLVRPIRTGGGRLGGGCGGSGRLG